MKDFILSFIIPKRIESHRDMNLFISVLLFILSFILCCSIPTFRIKPMVKGSYLDECLVYEGTYGSKLETEYALPQINIKDNMAYYADVEALDQHVFDLVYKTEDDQTINLKIVYELDNDKSKELTHINLNEYLNVNPFNEDKSIKSNDLLVVYTKDAFYYIYNHGYSNEYTSSPEGSDLEKYHYLVPTEWTKEDKWSFYKSDKNNLDENGFYRYREYYFLPGPTDNLQDPNTWSEVSFDPEKTVEYDGIKYSGYRKVTNYIDDIFQYGITNNIGKFTYAELNQYGNNCYNNNNPLEAYSDIFVTLYGESMRTQNYLTGIIYIIVLPLLWMIAIYLIMHKNGELSRFREYYSVGSIALLLPSILISIVGMFVPYYRFASIYMIVHAGYYLFVISRINKISKNKDNNDEQNMKDYKTVEVKNEDYTVETQPAANFSPEKNSPKPSQVE